VSRSISAKVGRPRAIWATLSAVAATSENRCLDVLHPGRDRFDEGDTPVTASWVPRTVCVRVSGGGGEVGKRSDDLDPRARASWMWPVGSEDAPRSVGPRRRPPPRWPRTGRPRSVARPRIAVSIILEGPTLLSRPDSSATRNWISVSDEATGLEPRRHRQKVDGQLREHSSARSATKLFQVALFARSPSRRCVSHGHIVRRSHHAAVFNPEDEPVSPGPRAEA